MNMIIILTVFALFLEASSAGTITPTYQDTQRINFILPGTNWCGSGNISDTKEDLGLIKKTDRCCRAHDLCPDSIPAGEYKHALHNSGWFTRSRCDCDDAFYKCLTEAGNPLSIKTGQTYFTILGPQCFAKVHPITKCLQYKFGRCVKYQFDETEPEVWQWMDNPIFSTII